MLDLNQLLLAESVVLWVAISYEGWQRYRDRKALHKEIVDVLAMVTEHAHPLTEQEIELRQHGTSHVPRMKGVTVQNIAGEVWRTTKCTECGATELHEVSS